jgi:hypothetical protein
MKKRDGGWWGNQQRSDKKDSREIRKREKYVRKRSLPKRNLDH